MKLPLIIFGLLLFMLNDVYSFSKPKSKPRKVHVTPEPDVTKVHIIFMNHLDVGYSTPYNKGYIANVLNMYFHIHFPQALNLAAQLDDGGYVEKFKYTTHPWLLDLYLDCPPNLVLGKILVQCPSSLEQQLMSDAIRRGIIQWHAGAMNIQYELYDTIGFNFSLNVAERLDAKFELVKPLRVLSQRDVPGITRGAIPGLVKHSILGITNGVNSGSAPPAVPPMFRWLSVPTPSQPNPVEVLFVQNPGGYPDNPGSNPAHPGGLDPSQCRRAPGTTEVLCFAFRTDNSGPPQSVEELLNTYEILRVGFPNAQLVPSSLEAFFSVLWSARFNLPVVQNEIGDTWIQGIASDMRKTAEFRAIGRALYDCYSDAACHPVISSPEVVNASRFYVKLAEHTWGVSSDGDSIHWTNIQFSQIRGYQSIMDAEYSWVEQRQFIGLTLQALAPLNTGKATPGQILWGYLNKELGALRPSYMSGSGPDLSGFTAVQAPLDIQQCTQPGPTELQFGTDGSLIKLLLSNGQNWAYPNYPMARLIYRTYNESDTDFFLRYYSMGWNTGYGKPNSTANAKPESREWPLVLTHVFRKFSGCQFLVRIEPADGRATNYYGSPSGFWLNYTMTDATDLQVQVMWFSKPPTRLMEAIYLAFTPYQASHPVLRQWQFSKLGSPISPSSVIKNGSQWQHAVDHGGVSLAPKSPDVPSDLRILALDTPIACPITAAYGPTVWPAPLEPINDAVTGVAYNIYNNVWMTNYIFWYPYWGTGTDGDDKFLARFTVQMVGDSVLRFVPLQESGL